MCKFKPTGLLGAVNIPYYSSYYYKTLLIACILSTDVIQGMNTGSMAGSSTIGQTAVAAQLAAIVGVNNAVLHVSNLNEEVSPNLCQLWVCVC